MITALRERIAEIEAEAGHPSAYMLPILKAALRRHLNPLARRRR